MKNCELALVMPVYNEEACICQVVDAWNDELTRLGINFQMIVLNDGSTDETANKLEYYSNNPRIDFINKANSGHGPTILEGYSIAVQHAEWIFQVDSDNEMSHSNFNSLWQQREGYVALFGCRIGRQQNIGRKYISSVSRMTVKLLFGQGVVDVNTPYRLIRSSILTEIIKQIPLNTFAPNILISGVIAASGHKFINLPVPHEGRKTGVISIVKWRLWKAAILSLFQTISFRVKQPKQRVASCCI
ncbi:putative glycosyltransferase [Geobacter sp. OR-1]|uniref:glycosyltransferase family 2 protein n=1 Tax=Geobacter sp. OR-1 TaxID=1266765 RepID=UPI000543AF15|nr:glycosyltransferase family 2 protein [Geobacter sp. OR-1]GAM08923.1 putative glycosyltransferase [Geobacter sp. OR-1]